MNKNRPLHDIVIPGDTIQHVDLIVPLEKVGKRAELAKHLGALGANNLFLLDNAAIPSEGKPDVTLTAVDQLSTGRQRSQHHVQFGQLVIEGGANTKTSELVAIKYLTPDRAAHEHIAAKYIDRHLGRQATFQTLGFIKHDDNKHVGIMSRYDHSVVSLDNTLYDTASTPESRMAAATVAAKYLATLHGSQLKLVHGDAQPKNIAVDSQKNPFFIDLESIRNVRANAYGKQIDTPEINKLMDISDFFGIHPDSHNWHPTFPEVDQFVDTYMTHQTGDYPLSDDQIMELVIDKIDDF